MKRGIETFENDSAAKGSKVAPASANANAVGQSETQTSSGVESKISIVVSDCSQMNSELLAGALSRVKDVIVLKCAITFIESLQAIVELSPDIAVVSAHLSDGPYRGLEILRRSRELFVRTRYIVLMDDSDHEGVIDAFRAGARGVFKRSAPMHLLGRCISAVNNGQIWATSPDLEQVIGALEKAMPFRCVNAHRESLLTKREQELIPLVAHGLTNKEISVRLSVSEHTIKNHLFRIYEKLGISSRVELILYAVSEHAKSV